MKDNDSGRSPDGDGLSSTTEPVSAVSALRASIPSAWPLAGYAPGWYSGPACWGCGVKLDMVDKRTVHCLECAVRQAKRTMDKGAKALTALRLFREFVIRNATQWREGAGDHHHPIWAMMSELLPSDDIRSGPEWRFILPNNREALSDLQVAASGIAAGTDETAQQAQPEGQEPGPQGDAHPSSPSPPHRR